MYQKQAVIKTQVPTRQVQDLTRRWVRINSENPQSVKLTARQQEIFDLIDMSGSVSVKELQYFTGVSTSVINSLEKKGIITSFENQEFRFPTKKNCKKS